MNGVDDVLEILPGLFALVLLGDGKLVHDFLANLHSIAGWGSGVKS